LLEKLLDEYPSSRHLAWPRVLSWRRDLHEAGIADLKSGTKASEGRTAQLDATLEGAELSDGPFDEDRLLLMADTALAMRDRPKERAAYEQLAAAKPRTAATEKGKRWCARGEPHMHT